MSAAASVSGGGGWVPAWGGAVAREPRPLRAGRGSWAAAVTSTLREWNDVVAPSLLLRGRAALFQAQAAAAAAAITAGAQGRSLLCVWPAPASWTSSAPVLVLDLWTAPSSSPGNPQALPSVRQALAPGDHVPLAAAGSSGAAEAGNGAGSGGAQQQQQQGQQQAPSGGSASSSGRGGWASSLFASSSPRDGSDDSGNRTSNGNNNGSGAVSTSGRGGVGQGDGTVTGPRHVVFFANGLFGSPLNWGTILDEIGAKFGGGGDLLLHASTCNRRIDTFDGIDVCGGRLADEMRSVIARHPSLERISVVGHSMGGLVLRYAVAQLYQPGARTIGGLQPAHFVTLATPHLGCDGGGEAQVPFIGWAGPFAPVLQALSVPTAAALFKRTGLQFFLADAAPETNGGGGARQQQPGATGKQLVRSGRGSSGNGNGSSGGSSSGGGNGSSSSGDVRAFSSASNDAASGAAAAGRVVVGEPQGGGSSSKPLLLRMTGDDTDRGLHFYSALRSFSSRTVYANTGQDHLVGWSNSSLRFLHQLPELPKEVLRGAKGVVLEDDVLSAFDDRFKPTDEPQAPLGNADVPVEPLSERRNGGSGGSGSTEDAAALMLTRLQRLPWRRIDVCFAGSPLAILSHNHIQVTRRWLNYEGRAVARHLADTLLELEETTAQLQARAQAGKGVGVGLGVAAAGVGSAGLGIGAAAVADRGLIKDSIAASGEAGGAGALGPWLAGRAAHPHGRTATLLADADQQDGGGAGQQDGGSQQAGLGRVGREGSSPH
ncbi:hypothetical protein FOA52_015253 [Chlamydomonas sp. UWO 241]|nr:hypothetical protein FOA52_015253 [Chlamydomonas sp. UWO 241]